jgi:S1-C subfamily serine protease
MTAREDYPFSIALGLVAAVALTVVASRACFAQADPASEPAVLAVAKVLPAVVNINTERVVRRTVRDPFEDFYAQFFGYNRVRPREIRQTLQSLGSGFIIDPAGYIVTNQHVVERAADLKIHVTTNLIWHSSKSTRKPHFPLSTSIIFLRTCLARQ